MRVLLGVTVASLILIFSTSSAALGLKDCKLNESDAEDSRIEHLWGGALDTTQTHARRAYVLAYDQDNLVPKWAAWHAIKDYRDTPKRKSRWKAFRTDPELPDVKDEDYVGWFDSDQNFARGHIVPYFVSGGDRDNDGMDAEYESNLRVEDEDDACTVFEINALSNIAPQFHTRFNGQPGVWWLLETDVRSMLDDGREFQIFAGTVFLDGVEVQKIGDQTLSRSEWRIGVPHGFFKVIVDPMREEAVGFLFDHAGDLEKGCNIGEPGVEWPSACIVRIQDIEAATGLKFFRKFNNAKKLRLHQSSTKQTWFNWMNTED